MEYFKCLVEVDEVLKYLNPEELIKIPANVRKAISENKDKNYEWKYDVNKKLEDQNLNRKSIAILSYLNMEYLLNDEQRKIMEKIHRFNEERQEEQKRKQYNPEEIFKRNVNFGENKSVQITNEENISNDFNVLQNVAICKKDKWYTKILFYIRSLFHKM